MHEGDCYYKDRTGKIIQITNVDQARELVDAAEQFTLWVDSLG